MQVLNQKKTRLMPICDDDFTTELTGDKMKDLIKSFIHQLNTPLSPQYPVEYRDDKNNPITEDDITDTLLNCMGDIVDAKAEKETNGLWKDTLTDFYGGLNASSVFLAQANAKAKLPLPSANVLYTASDIKDGCNSLISTGSADWLTAATGFLVTEPMAAAWFLCQPVFEDFKAFVKNAVNSMMNNISSVDITKFQNFDTMKLNTIEGLMLRNNQIPDKQDTAPYAFSRILIKLLMTYATQHPADCGIIAPYIQELTYTTNLLLFDVDSISKTPVNRLDSLLSDIRKAISLPYKPIGLNKLAKLSAIAQNQKAMSIQYNMHQVGMSNDPRGKRALFRFRKAPIKAKNLNKRIEDIIKREVNVAASENYAKTIKTSYMRANRRNPDNFNIPGKSIGLLYKPDIHIYLDTSGSISEENYKQAILTCICMAKKLGINMYFNSFSDEISGCAKLQLAGKSANQIYREFQRIPKVEGGTDFMLVWDYICQSKKRMTEISIMITDFGFYVPSGRFNYPKKMYYVPIDITKDYWPYIKESAEKFCDDMYMTDQNIRRKILM